MAEARLAALSQSAPGRAVSRRFDRNFRVRRVARRLGLWSPGGLTMPPEVPVGVKLELTHLCNLKCPFCYTDSPRHTRAGSADLTDDEWRAVVADAVGTGLVEAVVTGGEPLLRKELTLEIVATLSEAGIGCTLNTNGWFVDDDVADRLSGIDGLLVNISLDGATAELHDGARGGAGSWARAIAAADRLLSRGIGVRMIHVATPANVAYIEDVLDHVWLLGVPSMRLTRVGMIGAAARGGAWEIDSRALYSAVERFRDQRGPGMQVSVNTSSAANLAAIEDVAPAALLVRPSGAVMIDSQKPFRFGTTPDDSLQQCWDRICTTWPHPAVVEWAEGIASSAGIGRTEHIPYRDQDVEIVPAPRKVATRRSVDESKIPVIAPPIETAVDFEAARRVVVGLALARRYVHTRLRYTGSGRRGRFVRVVGDGRTYRLNHTAARVMDALNDGTPAAAVDELAQAYPGVARRALEEDVLASVRLLVARRVIEPVRR